MLVRGSFARRDQDRSRPSARNQGGRNPTVALGIMGLLLGFGRGTILAATVLIGFAILKRLVIVFGVVFALFKFIIVVAFLALLISIAVAMIRDWSDKKNGVKES